MNTQYNDWMEQAIALSRKSPAQNRYKVGAVIVSADNELLTTGYTQETDNICHAEEVAIAKARDEGHDLSGCYIYTTMEPCSTRVSRPKTCTELILDTGIRTVVFAYREPPDLADCEGAELLEQAGLHVIELPVYANEVAKINAHILNKK